MKFRKLKDLTKEEVEYIFRRIINPLDVISIEWNENEWIVNATTKWEEGEEEIAIEDVYRMDYRNIISEDVYNHAWGNTYEKYLLAKGCNFLLEDNEWL